MSNTKKMTVKEAYKLLDSASGEIYDQVFYDDRPYEFDKQDYEALCMAVDALKEKCGSNDLISRQAAIDAIQNHFNPQNEEMPLEIAAVLAGVGVVLGHLPSAQPEKEIPRRVIWSGWKGFRDTRYKCPNCKKPVKNDDVYCHRCGQKLMFPNISYTPYIEGQKQELIVRWDDEE